MFKPTFRRCGPPQGLALWIAQIPFQGFMIRVYGLIIGTVNFRAVAIGIEIYCSDYQTVDPDHEPLKWDLRDPQRQTLWGAAAPKSWFEHGSVFEGITPKDPVLKAQPIVAP